MAVGEIARTTAIPPPVWRTRVGPDGPAWLELGPDDRTARFMRLVSDLSRGYDDAGEGKRITCGHAYTGVDAAIAWTAVCRDPLCGAPRQSVESFPRRWQGLRASMPAEPCHYVSLGPGDGRKDGVLLEDLSRANADLCYLPVDAGEDLLHLAVRGLIRRLGLPTDRVLSLPWDFTLPENLHALRGLLDELFGPTPVLFSLLGNTIAHFDDDVAVLGRCAEALLRPGDRLLLEAEVTMALGADQVVDAVAEYEHSTAFGAFVAATLRAHTDLLVDDDAVELLGAVEDERALVVRTAYRNRTDADLRLRLPNDTAVRFPPDDTIRLALTRKYTPEGLATMLHEAGLTVTADTCTGTGGQFGLALLMLAVDG
ncbi:L-histidine N(alpha)-methyltransferase [Actinophytocola glycyrrhizae]|uniref:L-histidine N(Alpha)-methyltransferase n=1 Tax=Actinophytocola glycyrrhizae TaxID=2044873 RepID=A0ABV9SBK7_9PSEU